jgi:hypothetical protein
MSTALQIPIKYCKSLEGPLNSAWTGLSPVQASRFFHKLLYEWWGFVVNGGSSLTSPGGIEAVDFPSGFTDQVVASGADGYTSFGYDVFASNSADFVLMSSGSISGSLIGKYLVAWVPGSPGLSATDDGVYQIKAVEDANHIRVDINSGGTRRVGNHPWFWDRQNINWRIVDIYQTTSLVGPGISGSWDNSYQVLNFLGAPTVNAGQAVPQAQIFHTSSFGVEDTIGFVVSPAGTWTGSAFTDGTPLQSVVAFFTGTVGSPSDSTYSFIGATDFLIGEVRSPVNGVQGTFTAGTGFHIEIPLRNYSQHDDPNPIAWVTWSNATPSQIAATYYNGFNMVCTDGVVRNWTTLVRSPMGDRVRASYTGIGYGSGQWQSFQLPNQRFWNVAYDQYGDDLNHNDQYMTTDGILSLLGVPGQFSLARARLRRVRFTTATLSRGARLGDNITDPNGWVVVANGVLWPWDNSIMPEGPWRFGV